MWSGVYKDEWEGNVPLGPSGETSANQEEGVIVFSGDKIPWAVGTYEVRIPYRIGPILLEADSPSGSFDITTMENTT